MPNKFITILSLDDSKNNQRLINNPLTIRNDEIALISSLDPFLVDGLPINRTDILIDESLQIIMPNPISVENQTRIGAWVSFDKNFVSTPELHVNDGLSAGVNFSKKNSKSRN